MKIEMRKVGGIKPYAKNPRKNKNAVKYVENSIKEFGFRQPIVLDRDGVVIAGHTRLEAAKKLGMKEVPCVLADDLTDEQAAAYRLADNKTAEFAEWDIPLLDIELGGILDLDMGLFGFEVNVPEDSTEVIEDEFDTVPPIEPITKPGDVWQMGRHRLMCGDSTNTDDVQKLTRGIQCNLFLSDPPYNVDYKGKSQEALKIKNDKMTDNEFHDFLQTAFECADSCMHPGSAFYIWHADSEGYNFRSACLDIGWKVRQCLIWNKNNFVMGRQDYHWKHEPCLYGWKDGSSHLWASDRKQTTVLNFDRPTSSKEHPTMKPVRLFDYLIKNSTNKEDTVLDLFAGSGTTIIACQQNGRTAYCMELDPKYCDVIINRWQKFTGKMAKLIG